MIDSNVDYIILLMGNLTEKDYRNSKLAGKFYKNGTNYPLKVFKGMVNKVLDLFFQKGITLEDFREFKKKESKYRTWLPIKEVVVLLEENSTHSVIVTSDGGFYKVSNYSLDYLDNEKGKKSFLSQLRLKKEVVNY